MQRHTVTFVTNHESVRGRVIRQFYVPGGDDACSAAQLIEHMQCNIAGDGIAAEVETKLREFVVAHYAERMDTPLPHGIVLRVNLDTSTMAADEPADEGGCHLQ